jgi:hypothetical protein
MNEQMRNNRVFESAKEFHREIMAFFDVTCPQIARMTTDRNLRTGFFKLSGYISVCLCFFLFSQSILSSDKVGKNEGGILNKGKRKSIEVFGEHNGLETKQQKLGNLSTDIEKALEKKDYKNASKLWTRFYHPDLNVDWDKIDEKEAQTIWKRIIISKIEKKEVLDFRNIGIGDDVAKIVAKILEQDNTIKILAFGVYHFISTEGVEAIGRALAKNGTLKDLDMESYKGASLKWFDNGLCIQSIMRGFMSNDALRSLNLAYIEIDKGGAEAIGKALGENIGLQKLIMGNATDFKPIMKGLETNTKLEELSIRGNTGLKVKDIKVIAKAIKKNETLKMLSLCPYDTDDWESKDEKDGQLIYELDDESTNFISLALAKNRALECLYVCIENRALKNLAMLLYKYNYTLIFCDEGIDRRFDREEEADKMIEFIDNTLNRNCNNPKSNFFFPQYFDLNLKYRSEAPGN